MPAITESTKRKLSLLQLAEELGNVSKACRIMGYRRDTFYERRLLRFSEERNYRPSFQSNKKRPENKPPDHTTETPCVG